MTTLTQKFFHTLDSQGNIENQGEVISRNQNRVTVEFFSWMDGLPNGQKSFDIEATKTWRFYESEAAWNRAGDKVFA